jgi:hypothetical protein
MAPMRALPVLLSLLAAAPARAVFNPLQPPAVEFPDKAAWINAKPLTLERLKGRRVILLAFIDTANLNSRRAIKQLNAWHEAYATRGLMIIGVHAPFYGFQRDVAVVRRKVKLLGIQFPIVVDNDRRLWKSYQNEGWPAFYVIDGKGKVVFSLLGEQRYLELETTLRDAAWKIGHKWKTNLVAVDPPTRECGVASPDRQVVLGSAVIDLDGAKIGPAVYGVSREGELAKRGEWTVEGACLRLDEPNRSLDAWMRVIYRGAQAFAVLGPAPSGPTKFFVKQDDLWLHPGNAGSAIEFDDDGRSYVVVEESGLFELVQNNLDVFHALTVIPQREGAAIYSFSYADRCQRYAGP